MIQAKIRDVVGSEPQPNKGSGCEINLAKQKTEQEIQEENEAEKLGISVEKLRAAKAYAKYLVSIESRKGNRVKESTIRSKVAKKFNLKMS